MQTEAPDTRAANPPAPQPRPLDAPRSFVPPLHVEGYGFNGYEIRDAANAFVCFMALERDAVALCALTSAARAAGAEG